MPEILLVDDNEDVRMLLADALTDRGHSVHAAGNGATALALLDTASPNIAVVDIGLPDMSGYELAVKLRRVLPEIHLIALTGYGRDQDRARSQAAGFERHFLKPIGLHCLLDAFTELLREPAPPRTSA